MSDTWTRVDGGIDTHGKSWTLGHAGAVVLLAVDPTATVLRFDGEGRDRFMHAFAESERQAEAHAAPDEAEIDPTGLAAIIPRAAMNQVERLARDLIGIPDGL